jgi:hypothetical protein
VLGGDEDNESDQTDDRVQWGRNQPHNARGDQSTPKPAGAKAINSDSYDAKRAAHDHHEPDKLEYAGKYRASHDGSEGSLFRYHEKCGSQHQHEGGKNRYQQMDAA